ncbi:MAG: mobilome CxxCx(11)CxxC protein [Rhodocyclaceae bacterium]
MAPPNEIKFCRDKEIYAYGTAWLFQQRALAFRQNLNILSWLSLVVPIAVGTLLGTFDSSELTTMTRIGSGLLGGALAITGAWAVVAGWTDALSRAERSILANNELCDRWRELKGYAGSDFYAQLATLKERDRAQENLDNLSNITAKDKICMMRAALIQYGLPCERCGQVPTSLKPGNHNCAVCANS